MKKILSVFILSASSLLAMIRAGVDVGPDPVPEEDVYYDDWYGPGWYYGNYFYDYPTYHSWRRDHYDGGPYYWHHPHHWHGHHEGGHGGGGHHH